MEMIWNLFFYSIIDEMIVFKVRRKGEYPRTLTLCASASRHCLLLFSSSLDAPRSSIPVSPFSMQTFHLVDNGVIFSPNWTPWNWLWLGHPCRWTASDRAPTCPKSPVPARPTIHRYKIWNLYSSEVNVERYLKRSLLGHIIYWFYYQFFVV